MGARQKQSPDSPSFAINPRGKFFLATIAFDRATIRGLAKNPEAAIARAKSLAGLRLSDSELAALRAS